MTRLSIEQLGNSPELAALALLDTAAGTAILALAAVYPELQDVLDPDDDTAALRAAMSVIEHARALGLALARYRRALARERQEVDLTPF